jgi:hypothetical protein
VPARNACSLTQGSTGRANALYSTDRKSESSIASCLLHLSQIHQCYTRLSASSHNLGCPQVEELCGWGEAQLSRRSLRSIFLILIWCDHGNMLRPVCRAHQRHPDSTRPTIFANNAAAMHDAQICLQDRRKDQYCNLFCAAFQSIFTPGFA